MYYSDKSCIFISTHLFIYCILNLMSSVTSPVGYSPVFRGCVITTQIIMGLT